MEDADDNQINGSELQTENYIRDLAARRRVENRNVVDLLTSDKVSEVPWSSITSKITNIVDDGRTKNPAASLFDDNDYIENDEDDSTLKRKATESTEQDDEEEDDEEEGRDPKIAKRDYRHQTVADDEEDVYEDVDINEESFLLHFSHLKASQHKQSISRFSVEQIIKFINFAHKHFYQRFQDGDVTESIGLYPKLLGHQNWEKLIELDPCGLMDLVEKCIVLPVTLLNLEFTKIQLTAHDLIQHSAQEMIHKMNEVTKFTYNVQNAISSIHKVYNQNSYNITNYNLSLKQAPKFGKFDQGEQSRRSEPPVPNFINFCLNDALKKGLARIGKFVYTPIYYKNIHVFAYQKERTTIADYVNGLYPTWKTETSNMTTTTTPHLTSGAINDAISQIENQPDARLPECRQSRYLLSWRNGIYSFFTHEFFPFEKLFPGRNASPVQKEDSARLQRKLHKTIEIVGDLALGTTDHSKYEKMTDDEIFSSLKPSRAIMVDDKFSNTPYFIWSSLQYIPFAFEDRTDVKNWKDIITPSFDSFVNRQRWEDKDEAIVDMWYGLYGRNFYDLGDYKSENFQIGTWIIGKANAGKSTAILPLLYVYPSDYIGILETGIEENWAAHTLYQRGKTMIIIGSDVDPKCRLKHSIYKKGISQENLSLPIKNKDPYVICPRAPWCIVGNDMVTFETEGEAPDKQANEKRCAIFSVDIPVSTSEIRTNWQDEIKRELSLIIQKTNLAYRQLVDDHPHQDFWKFAPKEFKKMRDNVLYKNDHVVKFFNEQENVYYKHSAEGYVEYIDLVKSIQQYGNTMGIGKTKIDNDFIERVLENKNYTLEKASYHLDKITNKSKLGNWVLGIELVNKRAEALITKHHSYQQPQEANNNLTNAKALFGDHAQAQAARHQFKM